MKVSPSGRLPILRLGALTIAALGIHGYHLGVEDGEIYIPAARKLLDPTLYPFGTEFFLSHGRLSLFSPILAWTARLTHLSMDWTVLAWYVVCLFAMLSSCWLLAAACFSSERARWSGMLIMTAVLSMPAANTSLLLVDPYLTARSLSTPLTLFVLASFLERKYVRAAVGAVLTATIHPQMVVYVLFLTAVIWLVDRSKTAVRERVPVLASAASAGVLPSDFRLAPATGPYREALYSRDYFFLSNWSWYHWAGLLAPLAILAWFWKGNLRGEPLRGTKVGFQKLSFALIPFGLLSIAAGLVFSSSHELDMFARLQPLRSFHLITIVFVLLLGGVVGEYLGKGRPWAVAGISIGLAALMFVVARDTYPSSPQVELPSNTSSNGWANALLWVRQNTPTDAVFAVDSRYFKDEGTDVHGFRAVSERSALADYFKDGGVVALFPDLATEWKQMSNATYGLNHFSAADFGRLQQEYPVVSWTVVHGAAPVGLDCPYQQRGYAVCRLQRLTASATPIAGVL
ncbi:hypothetical protein [Acidicapsa ligni]|uniref:hypothetical protein n=1 Tax=Acidicapsa ligni TaxID=542300 RepID=UPI0021E019F9|nr:hypothetical protein [Acidicapsa ligni]